MAHFRIVFYDADHGGEQAINVTAIEYFEGTTEQAEEFVRSRKSPWGNYYHPTDDFGVHCSGAIQPITKEIMDGELEMLELRARLDKLYNEL